MAASRRGRIPGRVVRACRLSGEGSPFGDSPPSSQRAPGADDGASGASGSSDALVRLRMSWRFGWLELRRRALAGRVIGPKIGYVCAVWSAVPTKRRGGNACAQGDKMAKSHSPQPTAHSLWPIVYRAPALERVAALSRARHARLGLTHGRHQRERPLSRASSRSHASPHAHPPPCAYWRGIRHVRLRCHVVYDSCRRASHASVGGVG